MRNTLLDGIQNVSSCQMVYHKPAGSISSAISDLHASLSISKRPVGSPISEDYSVFSVDQRLTRDNTSRPLPFTGDDESESKEGNVADDIDNIATHFIEACQHNSETTFLANYDARTTDRYSHMAHIEHADNNCSLIARLHDAAFFHVVALEISMNRF